MPSETLAAGANERVLKYLVNVKCVHFILFIKKGEKWPMLARSVWVGLAPLPSPPAMPHNQHEAADAAGCEAVGYQDGYRVCSLVPFLVQ